MAPRRTRSSKPKQVTPPQANLTPIHHQINNDPPPPIPAIGNLPNSNEIIPPAGGLALTRPAPLNLFPSAFQEGHQSTSSALGPSRRPPATPFNFQTHPIDITPTSHSSTRFRFTDAPAPSTRIQAPSHKRARLDDIDEYRNSSGTSNHRGVRFQSPVTQSEDHHVFDSHPVSELDPVSEAQTASEADSGLDEAQPPTVDMSSDSEWSPDQRKSPSSHHPRNVLSYDILDAPEG